MTDLNKDTLKDKLEICLEAIDAQLESGTEILTTWECRFLESIETTLAKYGSLTFKQVQVLEKIYAKVHSKEDVYDPGMDANN